MRLKFFKHSAEKIDSRTDLGSHSERELGWQRIVLFLLFAFCICDVMAQAPAVSKSVDKKTKKINIKNADALMFDENVSDAQKLIGNVIFEHEGVLMYCDSALLYDKQNALDAFGHVHIQNGDSVNAYGDMLKYSGDTKSAVLQNNCRLTDKDMLLTSNNLFYDTKANIANYVNGGKIVNKENTLTSQTGYYYANYRDMYFKNDVKLVNKEYVVETDTMKYNTTTKTSFFYGPTTITSDENLIYCENGWYDSKNNKAQFSKRSWLRNKEQRIKGDSLIYDRKIGLGKAFRNVEIIDTTQKVTVYGDYVEYFEKQNKSLVTGRAMLAQTMGDDTLYLHGDTIKAVYDTIKGANKNLWAFHHVKFFKKDMRGKCDSLVYLFNDSLIEMFRAPILWNEARQMTAEKIEIKTYDGIIYSFNLTKNGFIVAEKDSDKYDQIKGKTMKGFFTKNELSEIHVYGNGETIYYAQEDKGKGYIGANKAECTDIKIYIKDNDIKRLNFINKPTATLFPLKNVKPEEFLLKDFSWKISQKPNKIADIFVW